MAAFACRSRDASGTAVETKVEADTVRDAMAQLEEDGLYPIEIHPIEAESADKPSKRAVSAAPEPKKAAPKGLHRVKVGRKEVMQFSVQLGSSLEAGIPILQSVQACADMTRNQNFQQVLQSMAVEIEGGAPLSDAMRQYPNVFPHAYVGTVAAGEASGTLEDMLENLVEFLEADLEVRSDVRSAIMYPAIVVVSLCLAVAVLVVFVVPRFTAFYSGFDTELPVATRMLMSFSTFLQEHYALVLLGMIGAGFALFRMMRIPVIATARDRFILKIPVLGKLIETSITLQVVQLLGLFTKAGVPILDAIRSAASTVGNTKIRQDLNVVADGISSGQTMAAGMQEVDCFPPEARHMLANGESTGSMERACMSTAKRYKKELRTMTKTLATLIEPMLTLVLAGIVLFIALAVFLPMWDLANVAKE
ncbi:MAG: type II secretion system F family protein [Planctomycetota bacterium]